MPNKIEISRELLERWEYLLESPPKRQELLGELRALLAAPVVERQEPVAIVDESDDGLFIEFIYGENGNPLQRGDMLYTSQPAPVAVVLPDDWQDKLFEEMERRFRLRKFDDDHMVVDDTQIGIEFAAAWIDACLDKVKELNP